MEKILQFLNDAKTFYLATVDENGQPRVRPFGAAAIIDGKLCICTNNQKPVYQQMKKNPKIEISGMVGGQWIRLSAEVCEDERRESKAAMLEAHPTLGRMYSLDDGIFAVMALTSGTAEICSFTEAPVEIKF
ncbi:MAG: pyridoxamine 5'-phosphate oxidase family protein [Clostridia bacterium]|nr:pyridoxamine 5'-phosphate oxidase family protein [Clostridia bacterium]